MSKAPRFVVYHANSTMLERTFFYRHHAEAYAAKMNAYWRSLGVEHATERPQYAVAPVEYYRDHVVYMVKRVNIMSKQEYWEKSNTPNYCSPASEAYWSM